LSVTPQAPAPAPQLEETYSLRSTLYERAGGFLVPLAATVLAFFIGGLVVLITGHNPIAA
jgi:general nucleoside transport system permease protein